MKKISILIIFMFSIVVTAQNINEINSDLNLSDSLRYETEIRIYQGGGITNYSSLFRMFKNQSKKWTAEFYEHYAEVAGRAQLKTKKETLNSKNDLEFVFQNLIRSHILNIPSEEKIQWKLGVRNEIEKVETTHKGKNIVEYYGTTSKKHIMDGTGFEIQAKAFNSRNDFSYSNPESYLKHYPNIDELIYMCEILTIVRNEFEIWKK